MTNPYYDQNFFGFIVIFIKRVGMLLTGNLSYDAIAADEIQIAVLCAIAASSALVGTFLVLKRMTMLANSLSHTILLGIVVVFWLTAKGDTAHIVDMPKLMAASVAMGIATTLLTEFLTRAAKLQEDASTGIVFTTLFAIGIVAVTLLTRNAHIGTEAVMGNVDALQLSDIKAVATIFLFNAVLIALFFKEYQITTFDTTLSKALGIAPFLYNNLLMVQVALTVVGAFRAVGVLMVLAFITGPVVAARLLTSSLKTLLSLSLLYGIVAALVGVASTRHMLSVYGLAFSTAGIVVCTIIALYLITLITTFAIKKSFR